MKGLLFMGALLVMIFSFPACELEPPWPAGPSESAKTGAYFLTGKSKDHAVIYDDYLSLFWYNKNYNNRCDVVRFSLEGDSYSGSNIRCKISFKLLGDNLTVKFTYTYIGIEKTKNIKLKRDPSVGVSKEEPIQNFSPYNVNLGYYNGSLSSFSWLDGRYLDGRYLDGRYIKVLGASCEVKYTGVEDFAVIMIVDFLEPPHTMYIIQPFAGGLTQGTHFLRLKHLGGPFIKEGEIRLSLDSEPVYYKLAVDSEGKISAEEFSEQMNFGGQNEKQ